MEIKLLTVKEVAEVLRLDPQTVSRYCQSGKILAYKTGNAWKIPERSIDIYLKGE